MPVMRNISIKHKLILVAMLTSLVALLSAAVGFIAWEWTALRYTMVQNLSTQAEIIADNCKAALAFQDTKDAEKTLNSLHVQPAIVLGCIYTNSGTIFASYYREGIDNKMLPPKLEEDSYSFDDGFLTVFRRVILEKETVGTVCLRSDMSPMYAMLKRNISIIVAVLLLSFLIAFLASSQLQKVISGPILGLAQSAIAIGKGELNHRVQVQSKDELGYLAESFNEMAEHLEQTTTSIDNLNREIVQRKKAEQELRAMSQYLENLFNCANAPIIVWNPQFKIMRFNQAFEALTGRSAHDVIGKSIKILFPTDKVDSSMEFIKGTTEGKRWETVEINILHLNGEVRTVLWNSATLFDLDGKTPVATIAQGQDVTERKLAEQALQASESKYRTLLENIPQRIFLKDRNSVYLSCNQNYANDLTIKPQEIVGRTDYEFYPEELAEKYRADDKRIMQSGQAENIEEQYILHGKQIPVQTVKTPVKDDHGNVTGVLGIFWDITERKKAEQRQTELLKKVENANRELKDFAYIVSHDLKAPLRGIKTLANWLSADYADKLDENGREQISLLSSRVDRMHNLIEGTLQYSRVGRVKEDKTLVNLNELVLNIIDSLAPPENITITIDNELPVIECEPTHVTQVFQNLLSNAIKYIDKPQGEIRVGSAEDDGFWKFNVTDNGPGIEEKHFEKIFQMFQTLSSRDDFESTGVGLTVVKKIVELNGGKIWLESKVGEGSTFFFTLPKKEMGVIDAKLQTNIVS
jgi:two-component system sensor kinase FixL